MTTLLDWIVGACQHGNRSRVFTTPKTKTTYVVCFDCKKRLPYDWKKMRIVRDKAAAQRIEAEMQLRSA